MIKIQKKCSCGCDIPYFKIVFFKIVFFKKFGIWYFKECTGDWWLRFLWADKYFKGWLEYSTACGWKKSNFIGESNYTGYWFE